MAETAIEGIISVNELGLISYWNPGADRMFDRAAAEAIGEPVTIALPERVIPSLAASSDEIVGTTFETVGTRRDGSTFPIELSLSSWSASHGARYVTGIARDITTRKSTEQAL